MNSSAPFFSWTCLFPDDTSYQCAPHTDWARDGDQSRVGNGHASVLVTAGQHRADLPDLSSYAGLAALNCLGVSDRRLLEAGFSYVRRFAVLPDAARARWFIPLDTPAISASSFCLCAPFRASARVRYQGCRAAARLALPLWYRDELVIAQRFAPPVEKAIQSLFPGKPLRLALSSGTPPPAINRKLSLAVLAPGGRVVAFAKLPGPCGVSDGNVRNEAAVLSQLAHWPPRTRVPRLLFAGSIGAKYLAVFTPLDGRPPCAEPEAAHHRFLRSLRSDQLKAAGDTAFVKSLSDRACLLDGFPLLRRALLHLLPLLRELRLPRTTVHGDFVPWNLRQHRGDIGAFDWEYAQIDGVPLVDETHHLLAVGYLLKRWSPEQAFRRLLEAAAASPLGLAPRVVGRLQLAYLLDYVLRLFREGHDDSHPRARWCEQIVQRLAPTVLKEAVA